MLDLKFVRSYYSFILFPAVSRHVFSVRFRQLDDKRLGIRYMM